MPFIVVEESELLPITRTSYVSYIVSVREIAVLSKH